MKKTEMILSTISMTVAEGKNIANAPFWKSCYHKDEVTDEMLASGKQWYEYHVKFDGTKAIQLTKTNKIRKPIISK